MESFHRRSFAEVGSVFCSGFGMPGRAVRIEGSKKMVFVKLNIVKIKKERQKRNTQRVQYSRKLLIEKRVRRAAPAAQRRLAGEPKAKPGALLPRSEINCQFLPASRFVFKNGRKLTISWFLLLFSTPMRAKCLKFPGISLISD